METMNNMRIYEAGRAVPKEAQKSFNNGKFSGTDINPMWRIKKMTELFGACGVGWYTEITRMDTLAIDNEIFAIVNINLYIKVDGEWSKPIFGTGGNKLKSVTKNGGSTSDEGFKMAYTDAISVACKALGIGADVYFDKDRTKYTQYAQESTTEPTPNRAGLITAEQVAAIKLMCSEDQIKALCAKYKIGQLADMTEFVATTVVKKLNERNGK